MSQQMTLNGRVKFSSVARLKEALGEVDEILEEESKQFVEALGKLDEALAVDGATISVSISVEGDEDWWFALEDIADALVDLAQSGRLEGVHGDSEEDVEVYEA